MNLEHYELRDILAVQWYDAMWERFPNADHRGCRQEMYNDGQRWRSYDPPRCKGFHCVRCGEATGQFGHRNCPNPRPQG